MTTRAFTDVARLVCCIVRFNVDTYEYMLSVAVPCVP